MNDDRVARQEQPGREERSTTSPALVAVAWLIVGLPFIWGVYRSGLNVVKLFQPPPPATVSVPPGTVAPAGTVQAK